MFSFLINVVDLMLVYLRLNEFVQEGELESLTLHVQEMNFMQSFVGGGAFKQ